MSNAERIFQSILFEILAILLSAVFVKSMGPSQVPADSGLMLMLIAISFIAVVWGFVFNKVFDYLFDGEKLSRPLWLRVLHIITFEGGLLCFTLPLIMWVLNIGFWQALMMDIALTLLILVYGFFFYWGYDCLRARLYAQSREPN